MRSLLADLTEEEFVRGVKTLVLTHKEIYPNTNLIAVIRDYALTDPSELSPEEAWGIVVAKKWGRPHEPNPLADKTISIMGWMNLKLSENEEADRAHFFKIYKSLQNRQNKELMMGSVLVP